MSFELKTSNFVIPSRRMLQSVVPECFQGVRVLPKNVMPKCLPVKNVRAQVYRGSVGLCNKIPDNPAQ